MPSPTTGAKAEFDSFIDDIFIDIFVEFECNPIQFEQFDILPDNSIFRFCQNIT